MHQEEAMTKENGTSKKLKNCSVASVRHNDRIELFFEGEITIYNVSELHSFITKETGKYDKVTLDLSKVNRLDTAGFQLMLYIKKKSEKENRTFHCQKPGSEAGKTFLLLGETIVCQGI